MGLVRDCLRFAPVGWRPGTALVGARQVRWRAGRDRKDGVSGELAEAYHNALKAFHALTTAAKGGSTNRQ
jgi:hypothetical protein